MALHLETAWRLCGSSVFWTLFLVNLAGIMERADEALLPAVYREMGFALHASPTRLGSLTLLRSIVQMLCFPLAAAMSMHHNRSSVIALGALLWALATFCVAISSNFIEVAISRSLNGIGLALVIPAIQSMVADCAEESHRGLAFGFLQFTGNMGGIIGTVFSVLLAGTSVFGVSGWRVAFHLIAILSVVVAFLVFKYAVDPHYADSSAKEKTNRMDVCSVVEETLQEAKRVVKIHTFIVIIAQGVAGTFPWAAMSFAPMWLELIGFSHSVTAIIIGLSIAANSLGGLFGGWLGDIFARIWPNSGRIILAQFSSGIGIPIGAVLLLLLPYNPSTALSHGAVYFIMSFLMSWCGTATNNPIFAEIVPERSRTSIYALDRSFESVFASFAPPIVGILAEHVFGFVTAQSQSESTAIVANPRNAAALAKALYVCFGIPFTVCCAVYSFLYWTYPKDRDALRSGIVETEEEILSGVTKAGYVILKKQAEMASLQDPPGEESQLDKEKQHMLSGKRKSGYVSLKIQTQRTSLDNDHASIKDGRRLEDPIRHSEEKERMQCRAPKSVYISLEQAEMTSVKINTRQT